MSVIYDRVAFVGLGLIASSMIHAGVRAACVGHTTGFARSQATRDTA
ncbi:MAG: prephenate/arogenate dehydrogenase family protein, partial [Paracoccaceae bacterium]